MKQLPALPVDLNGASDRHDDDHERCVTSNGTRRVDRVEDKLNLAVSPASRYPFVAAVGHQHVPVAVEGDTGGAVELVGAGALCPEHEAQKTSLGHNQLYHVIAEKAL